MSFTRNWQMNNLLRLIFKKGGLVRRRRLSMTYVTHGKVQIEIKETSSATIWILPIQDYAIKCEGTNFTIFVGPGDGVKKFPISSGFSISDQVLISALVNAAVTNMVLEITIDDVDSQ